MNEKNITFITLLFCLSFICNQSNIVEAYNNAATDKINDCFQGFDISNFTINENNINYLLSISNQSYNCSDVTNIGIQNQPGITDQTIIVSLNSYISNCSENFTLYMYIWDEYGEINYDKKPVLFIHIWGNLSKNYIKMKFFNYITLNWSIEVYNGTIIGQSSFNMIFPEGVLDRQKYYSFLAFYSSDNYTDLIMTDNLFISSSEQEVPILPGFDFSVNIDFINLIKETMLSILPVLIIYTVLVTVIIVYFINKKRRILSNKRRY